MARLMKPYDGNSAVAHVAHATNEVIAIYPITPSSPMGEISDQKSASGEKNIWGTTPVVAELQSEGGASGAVHGALTSGALTTTFTASQGLLLMIPNMHKIAAELLPTVFHIAARSLACQALSIFGDHSDVMNCRTTGWAFLASGSVQEAMDFALIAQAATLKARIPFLHFFEGFRVSHEIQKIEELTYDDMKHMIDNDMVRAHKSRGMKPENPVLRGTSQNPDVYFQGRETVNKYYLACSDIVQQEMDKFADLTGRQYHLFDYIGDPEAERVIIMMGSGSEAVHETVEYLNEKEDAKLGLVKVRLYRPFNIEAFVSTLPATVRKISVLDRTKEPGSLGEPLYLDVIAALEEAAAEGFLHLETFPFIYGGRYGLGSKEFTPAMAKAVFDNLAFDSNLSAKKPKNHFTVGIEDDVTNTHLDVDYTFSLERDNIHTAKFYGLGSDGTVGANKNSIKIIAEKTDFYAQGYFEYDSKKAGAITVSHLRFGKDPIRSSYLITKADFLACHNFSFLEKYDMLKDLKVGGTFLLASPFSKEEVWEKMPSAVQKQIIDRKVKFYIIDALSLAEKVGLGARINTIMQVAFFKISGVIDEKIAIDAIKEAAKKTYAKKGDEVVNMNLKAIDMAIANIIEIDYPAAATSKIRIPDAAPADAPDFVKNTTAMLFKREGDKVKVSQMPADGTWPTATTQYEKRNVAVTIPVWNEETCIQCGQCSLVCPHAAIRPKAYSPEYLKNAPETFKSADGKGKDLEGLKYTLQVAPEDCTGCGTCVFNCPMKAKEAIKMEQQLPLREKEAKNWKFFLDIPETDPSKYKWNTVKGSQFIRPLFEFSGACAGCGETAYVKLLTQLFGDRAIIANATGCSSIYGGNLPTTPYCTRDDGRGPTWNNSLFEDNAEIAYGMRLTVDKFKEYARELLDKTVDGATKELFEEIKTASQKTPSEIEVQRARVDKLKGILEGRNDELSKELLTVSDYLVEKSVWALGGDGWAYDIGYGGLDHVLAMGKNVNILVMDTEVYSNTGGQSSKATSKGAVAKFAAAGKPTSKKDLGMINMTYGYVYVAKIALGANPNQAIKALIEAEAYDGPSIVICYSHCIAHGIDMTEGLHEQKLAVESGHWQLYRFNPENLKDGKNPFTLDSKPPKIGMEDYRKNETRFTSLAKLNPEAVKNFNEKAEAEARLRYHIYDQLTKLDISPKKED